MQHYTTAWHIVVTQKAFGELKTGKKGGRKARKQEGTQGDGEGK